MATAEPTHRSGRLHPEGRLVLPVDVDDVAEVADGSSRGNVGLRVPKHRATERRGNPRDDGERGRGEVGELDLHAINPTSGTPARLIKMAGRLMLIRGQSARDTAR